MVYFSMIVDMIEVNDQFHLLAAEVSQALKTAGFVLAERRHSEMFEGGAFANTFNQIYVRRSAEIGADAR